MRHSHYSQWLSLPLLSVAVTQQLYAQPNESLPTVELEPVVITIDKSGMALANRITQMPHTTKVIYEEQIQEQATGSRQLADVMAQLIPSLGVSSGTTSNFGQTMHGRQVQFLLNGVPLTGSRDISRQLNSINPNQVARIEVLSGATSIYGSGATGGLINIVTKSDLEEEQFETRIGVHGSKLSSEGIGYQVGQSVAGVSDNGNVLARLDVDYRTTGGAFDANGKRIAPEPAQTDKQDSKSLSVNTNVDWQLDDKQNINLALTHYNDKQDTDYAPDYGNRLAVLFGEKPSLNAIKGLSLSEQPKTTKSTFNINYHHDDLWGNTINTNAYYRREKGRFYPFVAPFSTAKALPILQSMNLPPATLDAYTKALQARAYGVLQSESKAEVLGTRLALQRKFDLAQKPVLLSYGIDYEQEKNRQGATGYDLTTFMQSNGLEFKDAGNHYTYGPDTTLKTYGIFTNANIALTDDLKISAGVRHQRIDSKTDDFVPPSESLLADLLIQNKVPYQAGVVNSGKVKHHKTLFNLGANYQLTPNHSIFANFGQGYSLPDLQRVLRDVGAGFVVNSDNVEPITVNSYDAGWVGVFGGSRAKLTGFYNTSDKVTQFLKDYSVVVADTDERIYGAEFELNHKINDNWAVGGSIAYTRGQYKDASGQYRELGAFRISPTKATTFAQYTTPSEHKLRLQLLAIGGTDNAYQDSLVAITNQNVRKTPETRISGYVVADLLGEIKLPKGQLNFGVYNLMDADYKSVFSQAAKATYGELSSLSAQGRSYGISYTLNY